MGESEAAYCQQKSLSLFWMSKWKSCCWSKDFASCRSSC